jgi:hypothetical protein
LRIAAQLLALFLLCLAGCWLLDRVVHSRPTVISGKVTDWGTGQPAPYTEILEVEPNSFRFVARTDAHGEFAFVAPNPPDVYFLFAGAPRYGKLLQTTFGQTVVVYRPGARVRDVVIPAIPATGLSGHVYGADGQPISGCDVSAITRDNRNSDKFVELQVRGVSSFTWGVIEDDDPNKFIDVESARTGPDGSYTFQRLGADRYFVLARCRELVHSEEYPRFIWEPMVYPQATSIAKAQEILLLPGERRSGIDFHMQRKRSYAFEGRVIFSDGSAPKPWAVYDHDLKILRADRTLTSTGLAYERCDWDASTGTFRCSSLLPGTYTLYFDLSGMTFNMPAQFARVSYTVQAKPKQQPLIVQLHNVPSERSQTPKTGPGGFLELRKVCGAAAADKPQIRLLSWGHGHAGGACYYMSFFGNTQLPLPEDTYTVNAFEAAFAPQRSHLGKNSKFEAVLMQRGVRVHIHVGRKSEPVLPVLTTSDLIDIALESLRQSH